MKNKKLIRLLCLLLSLGMLVCSLTGCAELDYRKAVNLYNSGKYDAAIDAFYELGDYEDSKDLFQLSHYWAAMSRMEAGNYSEALPRFLKLGDYEDSTQRAVECKYQLGLVAFESGNFTDAQNYFRDVADYRQSGEYLRRIHWQTLYDAVAALGDIHRKEDGKTFAIHPEPDHPDQLHLSLFDDLAGEEDAFCYRDQFHIILSRDSTTAVFTAHSYFGFRMNDETIGSSQDAQGTLDISACTPETQLVLDTFELTGTDNHGNAISSTDPADCLMYETMQENFAELLDVIPQLLEEAGIHTTLQDIGFASLA